MDFYEHLHEILTLHDVLKAKIRELEEEVAERDLCIMELEDTLHRMDDA